MYFLDRRDAGRRLAQALAKYKGQDAVIFALPRGGVVVADEIAKFLEASLDLVLAHKIGHPRQPEYAIAAVSESGQLVGNKSEIESVDSEWFESQKEREMEQIRRRRISYLKGKKTSSLEGKIAIIVDDGIATGLTMLAAILELKVHHPKQIVVAVPVSPKDSTDLFRSQVDEFIALDASETEPFKGAVGAYYHTFLQVEDEEVIRILESYIEE